MDIELIVEIVMLFGVYIVAGIILPILLYFELKRFVKELRKNIKE